MKDLFWFENIEISESTISAKLMIHADDRIFLGHFPQQPVLPGVCMIHMVKSLCGNFYDRKINFKRIDRAKFIQLITPELFGSLTIQVNIKNKEAGIFAGEIRTEEQSCFSLQGEFNLNP